MKICQNTKLNPFLRPNGHGVWRVIILSHCSWKWTVIFLHLFWFFWFSKFPVQSAPAEWAIKQLIGCHCVRGALNPGIPLLESVLTARNKTVLANRAMCVTRSYSYQLQDSKISHLDALFQVRWEKFNNIQFDHSRAAPKS